MLSAPCPHLCPPEGGHPEAQEGAALPRLVPHGGQETRLEGTDGDGASYGWYGAPRVGRGGSLTCSMKHFVYF